MILKLLVLLAQEVFRTLLETFESFERNTPCCTCSSFVYIFLQVFRAVFMKWKTILFLEKKFRAEMFPRELFPQKNMKWKSRIQIQIKREKLFRKMVKFLSFRFVVQEIH